MGQGRGFRVSVRSSTVSPSSRGQRGDKLHPSVANQLSLSTGSMSPSRVEHQGATPQARGLTLRLVGMIQSASRRWVQSAAKLLASLSMLAFSGLP